MARKPSLQYRVQHVEPPWSPTALSKFDVYAFRALYEGQASEGQQKRVVELISRICGGTELEFRPEGERASAFSSGKRFVWLELVKLLKLPGEYVDTLK